LRESHLKLKNNDKKITSFMVSKRQAPVLRSVKNSQRSQKEEKKGTQKDEDSELPELDQIELVKALYFNQTKS
jgi:hypothetical protein